jgi:hypothetical protein
MIVLGGTAAGLSEYYVDVVQADTVAGNSYCMPSESNLPVFVARRPRTELKAIWDELKIFI